MVYIKRMNSEIQTLLNKNTLSDLNRFLNKRQSLNQVNTYLNYFFHLIQTSGLLTTSIGQSYGWSTIIWLGIGLNSLATLIHIYEQTNNSISKHMMESIQKIKNGTYIDEDLMIGDEAQTQQQAQAQTDGDFSNV